MARELAELVGMEDAYVIRKRTALFRAGINSGREVAVS